MRTNGWTNEYTDRHTDRQAGRQADRQTDRQADRQKDKALLIVAFHNIADEPKCVTTIKERRL